MPYCPSVPGIAPHNYQAVIDVIAGTGVWLWCNQCGDYMNVDGTAMPVPVQMPQTGSASPNAATPSPRGGTGQGGSPFP